MLSDTRCPGSGPRERASYRAVLCLDISVRSVFTICHLSHHWDCQCFNACVKYKAHLPLSSLVVSEDLPWKPSGQSTLIQGPKWGAWSADFKPSLSLLTASLQCAWEHTVKVGMGDYSLQVNRGSLLFFDFPFAQATGLSLWGLSARQHLMLSGGGGQKQTSLSILWLCSRVGVDPPRTAPVFAPWILRSATHSEVWISSSLWLYFFDHDLADARTCSERNTMCHGGVWSPPDH